MRGGGISENENEENLDNIEEIEPPIDDSDLENNEEINNSNDNNDEVSDQAMSVIIHLIAIDGRRTGSGSINFEVYGGSPRSGTVYLGDSVMSTATSTTTTYIRITSSYTSYAVVNTNQPSPPLYPLSQTGYAMFSWNTSSMLTLGLYMFTPYTITLNGNGGKFSNGSDTQSMASYYGHECTPTATPTREGYTFAGWSTSRSGSPSSTITIESNNEVLYAQWEGAGYTVSFDSNEGSDCDSITVTYGGTYGTLPEPTRTGYTFAGWYLNSDLTGDEITSSTTVSTASNHTLYAKWNANRYYIDINMNDPSGNQQMTGGAGTFSILTESGKVIEDLSNEGDHSKLYYGNSFTIFNIQPAAGMIVSNVTVDVGSLTQTTYNSTTAYQYDTSDFSSSTAVDGDDYAATININMAWKEYNVNINILSPTGAEDNKSGTVDLSYSSPSQTHNDVNNEPSPSRLTHGATLTISDIKPADGYYLESVSITDNRGTLENNGDGTYTFTASADWTHQTNWYNTIVVQMAYKATIVTYNSNGGSEVASDYVRYSDTYGKMNLYQPLSISGSMSMSNNIYSINFTNSGSGTTYLNFTQPFDGTYSPSTTYTVVVEVLSFSNNGYGIRITSPYDVGPVNQDVSNGSLIININETGVYTGQMRTLDDYGNPPYNLRSYIPVFAGQTITTTFRISIFTGNIYYDNFTYATVGNTPSSNNLPSPTRTGYTFAGWYKETSFQNLVTSSTVVSTIGDHTLYAKWNANQYTVSYSSDGSIVDTTIVTYGNQYGELLSLTREGYTFDGWYLDSTFVTPITATTTVQTPRDHTLYAKWTAKNPAQYDEELGKWYVEMGKYPQTSIIDSDLRNWTEYNGSNYSNITYDKTTKMSTFTITTISAWEILAIEIPAPLTSSAGETYTLTFDYVVPNYNGLVSSDYSDTEQFEGSDGLAVQIINSNGPANTHCTDRDYLTYRLPTTASSGTVTATFTNISSTNTMWVVLNGGYVGDGQTLTISIGNFRLLTDAVNLTTSGNTYRLPTKQLEENMTHWTEYFYGENIATSYNNVTKQNTLTISASSGWEIIGTQVQVIENTNYTINLNLISGATNSASNRPRLQVLNAAPTNGDNSSSQIAYLDLVDNGSKSLTFNSGNYETLYIILNGGYLNDGSTYNFTFAEFSFKNGKQEAYGTKRYNSYILSDGNEYLRYSGNWYKVEPVRYYLTGDSGSLIEETTFTGSNSINLGREYMYTDKITVSLWAYMDDWSLFDASKNELISCTESAGWGFVRSSEAPNLVFEAYDAGYGYKFARSSVDARTLISGWHMFSMTFDGEYLCAYIDGELVGQSEKFQSGEISYFPNNVIFVGAEAAYNQTGPLGEYFQGKIKGVYILNEALDQSEIQALMNGGYYSGYGTENGNVTAVSEKVIFATIWNDEYVGLGGGYTSSNSTIWNNHDNQVLIDMGLWDGSVFNEYGTQKNMVWKVFTDKSGNTTVSNNSLAYAMPTATVDMDEVFGEGNYETEFSDLVADILGNALMYWTRDVGSELNNAECITKYGTVIQAKMQNLLGARITTNVKTFACV